MERGDRDRHHDEEPDLCNSEGPARYHNDLLHEARVHKEDFGGASEGLRNIERGGHY